MKKELVLLTAIILISMSSCRSNDTDQVLQTGGQASVKVNLTGTDYAEIKGGSLAALKGLAVSDLASKQRQLKLVTPSSYIEAELSSVNTTGNSSQASLKSNLLASATGEPLGTGMKFRVIAYRQNNGSYQDHKDYTVGQPADGLILDNGVAYDFVVYSYGASTLPDITAGEKIDINSGVVSYDNANPDFMYQKVTYTPTNLTNTLPITLRHKLARITTTVNSIGYGDITSITNAYLNPNFTAGSIALSSGSMTRTGGSSNVNLSFTPVNNVSMQSAPVLLNADTGGVPGGSFSADITVGGVSKTISLPNSFKISPENNSNLAINLRKCGAYIGPNTNPANFKEFMCQNLGATPGISPFSPEAGNQGAKYQWGYMPNNPNVSDNKYLTQSDDQTYSSLPSNIIGWNQTPAPDNSWNNGTELTPVKGDYDPCPSGFRVPTQTEWQAVIDNNTVERTDSWNGQDIYKAALYFTTPSKVRTLMLPAAGYRDPADGLMEFRSYGGEYWSSTHTPDNIAENIKDMAHAIHFSVSELLEYSDKRSYGFSVRCIAQ
ncbi:fibrobacter succinogenes major paralogous domain-containing protein [Elizabethkingia anophelis]|uniref:FISUMP domain-containing protein n=1 Tax=Elizabethkingia anophelis TaxID=1117645 RepID=UPI00136FE61D|nr:FISUMP domain-containing protein [Elizabethkingia anophelis]MYY25984.1 hypothetical protein [Elizabethkingia anophelis]